MSKRARRGLGFVVLAVIALLVWFIAVQTDAPALLGAVAALALIGCGIYGLVTLAWGLIRD